MFVSSFNAVRFGQFTAVTRDGQTTTNGQGSGNTAKVDKMAYKATLNNVLKPSAAQKQLSEQFDDTYNGIKVETRDGVVTIGQ